MLYILCRKYFIVLPANYSQGAIIIIIIIMIIIIIIMGAGRCGNVEQPVK